MPEKPVDEICNRLFYAIWRQIQYIQHAAVKPGCTMKKLCLCFFTCMAATAFAQTDTIMVYHVQSKTIDTILPLPYDSTVTAATTPSHTGSLPGFAPLSMLPPTANLFSGSDFCHISRAADLFNTGDYPLRTATSIQYYYGDSLQMGCSGIMVAPNMVLTAAHCMYNFAAHAFAYDSILISPGYTNGLVPAGLAATSVKNVYLFKQFYDGASWQDIALLELNLPIGLETGWVGMGFDTDTAWFRNKTFHKLSYPAFPHPGDPSLVYNGDTMYYNYGYIDQLSGGYMGVMSPEATGIPGQSGSSLFYTDNTSYQSYGVFCFSGQYSHLKITPAIFFRFKNILDNYVNAVPEAVSGENPLLFYPNPFTQQAVLEFSNPGGENYMLDIYSAQGKCVMQVSNIDTGRVYLQRHNLARGMYIYNLYTTGKVYATGKFIIE